jgi:hypothetical protein
MPYSKPLEEIAYPHEADVVRAALDVLAGGPGERRLQEARR